MAPAKPGDKTYKELVDALTAHLAPKPLVIAERFCFHKRVQKEGESIKVYAASLQKLAEHCALGQLGRYPAGPTGMWYEERKGTAKTTDHGRPDVQKSSRRG